MWGGRTALPSSLCPTPRLPRPVGLLPGPTAAAGMCAKASSWCPSTAPLMSGRSGSAANAEHTEHESPSRHPGALRGLQRAPEEGRALRGLTLPVLCPARGSFPMENPRGWPGCRLHQPTSHARHWGGSGAVPGEEIWGFLLMESRQGPADSLPCDENVTHSSVFPQESEDGTLHL